jgi:hypothetical protein
MMADRVHPEGAGVPPAAVPSEAPRSPASSATRRFSALRNRNFALLWTGQVISNSGSWMQIVAQGILV